MYVIVDKKYVRNWKEIMYVQVGLIVTKRGDHRNIK